MNFCILHTDDTCSVFFLVCSFSCKKYVLNIWSKLENILFQFLISICSSIYNLASSHLFQLISLKRDIPHFKFYFTIPFNVRSSMPNFIHP